MPSLAAEYDKFSKSYTFCGLAKLLCNAEYV